MEEDTMSVEKMPVTVEFKSTAYEQQPERKFLAVEVKGLTPAQDRRARAIFDGMVGSTIVVPGDTKRAATVGRKPGSHDDPGAMIIASGLIPRNPGREKL